MCLERFVRKLVLLFLGVCCCSASLCNVTHETKVAKGSWVLQPNADRGEMDFRFFLHHYRQATAYILEQCALFCIKDSRCKSYNYLGEENICELNHVDRTSIEVDDWLQHDGNWIPTFDKLIRYPGSQYHSRESLSLTPESLSRVETGPCSSLRCPDGFLCTPAAGDGLKPACVKVKYEVQELRKQWSAWSSWGVCTTTCGGGVQKRTRVCEEDSGSLLCIGQSQDARLCMEQNCPLWSQWEPWSECGPNKCGVGKRQRSRTCRWGVLPDHKSCNGSSSGEISCPLISCTAPLALSNGKFGYLMVYDDRVLFNPIWRDVCQPKSAAAQIGAQLAVCRYFNLVADVYVADRNLTPADGQELLHFENCTGEEQHPMACFQETSNNCTQHLYVNCTAPQTCDTLENKVSGYYRIYYEPLLTSSFLVYCVFIGNQTVTVMSHNTTSEVKLLGQCSSKRCYRYNVDYNNTLPQIVSVIEASSSCRQFVKVRCFSMALYDGAWLARDGSLMKSWGTTTPDSCSCGDEGTCYDASRTCNCYANRGVTLEDFGYLTDKSKLPFIAGLFGDLEGINENGWLTLGPLECFV